MLRSFNKYMNIVDRLSQRTTLVGVVLDFKKTTGCLLFLAYSAH